MSKLLEDRNLSDISVEILQNVHTDVVEDKLIFSSLLQAVRKMTGRRQEQKVFLGGTKQLLINRNSVMWKESEPAWYIRRRKGPEGSFAGW